MVNSFLPFLRFPTDHDTFRSRFLRITHIIIEPIAILYGRKRITESVLHTTFQFRSLRIGDIEPDQIHIRIRIQFIILDREILVTDQLYKAHYPGRCRIPVIHDMDALIRGRNIQVILIETDLSPLGDWHHLIRHLH